MDALIGTPGGRFWQLDFETATARLLCGPENCLPRQNRSAKAPKEVIPGVLDRASVVAIEGGRVGEAHRAQGLD